MAISRNEAAFSKASIDALKPSPDGKRLYYYDTKLRGLELCIHPTGKKSFAVYKWVDGGPRRVQIGYYHGLARQGLEFHDNPLIVLGHNPPLTVEHARQLAQAVMTELSTGEIPRKIKRKEETKELTLGQLFDEYIDKYAMEHTKTWSVMQECFKRYLSEWQNQPVKEITRGDVQYLVNKLGKSGGKTTANRTLELLKAVINKGKLWGLVAGDNPAVGVTKYKLQPRKRFVMKEELPRLLPAIYAEENEAIRDYVLISLSVGARKTNVLSMRWEQLDLMEGSWKIPGEIMKNGQEQTILLTDDERDILQRRFDSRQSFEWVFPGPDKTKHLKDPKKGWARILKRAGISNLHLHDLRKTLGAYMAMSGVSLSVIGNALNHKDLNTTRNIYALSAWEAEKAGREMAHEKIFKPKTEPVEEKQKVVDMRKQIEF